MSHRGGRALAVSSRAKRPGGGPGEPAAQPAAALDLGPLDDYIGFHLRRAQEAALRAFAARLSEPYKPARFPMLLVIRLNPGLSQSDVGRAIGRDKSTLSPLIRELVHDGLVARAGSERDRRSVHLHLTAKGEAALDRLLAQAREHDAQLDEIAGEGKPALIAMLKNIAAALG